MSQVSLYIPKCGVSRVVRAIISFFLHPPLFFRCIVEFTPPVWSSLAMENIDDVSLT